MLNRAKMALAALAVGGIGFPAMAVAQSIETADAAKSLAQADETIDTAEPASEAVVQVTNWVIASGDNDDLPFIVIDKIAAAVFVFDAEGQLMGTTPALLGVARGDDSTPGIGSRELSTISPDERTTPAGRFLAEFGPASGNREVLWVDYATSVALHPVVTDNEEEQRPQRLQSPSSEDNRITYGCINVSASFYEHVVSPLFMTTSRGVVYILPEIKPLNEVFPIFHAKHGRARTPKFRPRRMQGF